ncbi:MAG: AbrB/MazE/SpoVT family DNA-binding domain-containing protein [Oscillospiraceae bacterium]
METKSAFRKIDELGRIVIPIDIRRKLGVNNGESLEIALQNDTVILKKHQETCIFCFGSENLSQFEGKLVCSKCIEKLKKTKETKED